MNQTPGRFPCRTYVRKLTCGCAGKPGTRHPRTRTSSMPKATRLTCARPCQRSSCSAGGTTRCTSPSGTSKLAISRCDQRAVRKGRGNHSPSVGGRGDRKSTRLNSSHLVISYAVFCLKKKKKKK